MKLFDTYFQRIYQVSSYITPEQKKNDKKGCFPDVDGHIVVQYRYTTDVFFIVLMILFLLVLVSIVKPILRNRISWEAKSFSVLSRTKLCGSSHCA